MLTRTPEYSPQSRINSARSVGVEDQSVVHGNRGNPDGEGEQRVAVIVEVDGQEVDVPGGPARAERREQRAALEHQGIPRATRGQPRQKAFQDVQVQQFLRGPVLAACLVLQIQVGAPCLIGSRGSRHSMTSRAARSGGCARGQASAIASRWAGWEPGWRSHRRSASIARSVPLIPRVRKASMMLRSAL